MKIPRPFPLVTLLLAAFGISAAQKTPPPFTLTLSAAQGTIRCGAEVRVQIALTNVSDHDIVAVREPGDDEADAHYSMDVRDEDGQPAPESALSMGFKGKDKFGNDLPWIKGGLPHGKIYIRWGHNIQITLKPGESLKEECVLSRFYDLTLSGKYTVQLTRDVPAELGSGPPIKSNVVTVTIM
jgi:hypothetical protein